MRLEISFYLLNGKAMHAYIRNLATQTFATMNLHGKISPPYKTTTVVVVTSAGWYDITMWQNCKGKKHVWISEYEDKIPI